ncbi:MAG TPA: hypothetical protein VGI81_13180 [Tepidisphaeraceae bacterium]
MSLEAALAGLVALALIVVILAGVFSLGQRRLGEAQTATPGGIVQSQQTLHGTPGLQAPAPLPQARVRPINPVPMTDAPEAAVPPSDPAPQGEAALAPPGAVPGAPQVPGAVAPSIEAMNLPGSFAPTPQPRVPLGDYLGFSQFTKIRDAYLNRPDPVVNHANLPRPQATGDLAQVRAQSRLTPQAVRELVAERQATQSLWQLRSQAGVDPNRLASPATRPSPQ